MRKPNSSAGDSQSKSDVSVADRRSAVAGGSTLQVSPALGGGVPEPSAFSWPLARALLACSHRAYVEATIASPDTDTQVIVELNVNLNAIIVAFRGSSSVRDFLTDAQFHQRHFGTDPRWQAHDGFLDAFASVRVEVRLAVRGLLALHPSARVFITGHSLGGALAILAAFDFHGFQIPVAGVYTFGQPRVGNVALCMAYDEALRDVTFRIVNQNDIVPRTPGVLCGYLHCGNEIFMQPGIGWGLNPSLGMKLLFDVFGLWGAYRRRDDVLFRNHFISAYEARIARIES